MHVLFTYSLESNVLSAENTDSNGGAPVTPCHAMSGLRDQIQLANDDMTIYTKM